MNNRRDSQDGFNGNYPPRSTVFEQAYYDLGLIPPWLLEYEDGKVVGPKTVSELRRRVTKPDGARTRSG